MAQNTQIPAEDIKIAQMWDDRHFVEDNISILIVDDSIVFRSVLRNSLLEKNFNVFSAREAGEAFRILDGGVGIDLIITDFHMPGLDGAAFIAKVREYPEFAETPILVMTTGTDEEEKRRARDAGASAWVVKPFEIGKLAAAIHVLVPDPREAARLRALKRSVAVADEPKKSMLKVRYDSRTGLIHTVVDGPTDREGVETYLASLHKLMDRARSEHGLCRHLVDARNLELQSTEALTSLAGSPFKRLCPEDRTAVVMASARAIAQRRTLPVKTISQVFGEMEPATTWLLTGVLKDAITLPPAMP